MSGLTRLGRPRRKAPDWSPIEDARLIEGMRAGLTLGQVAIQRLGRRRTSNAAASRVRYLWRLGILPSPSRRQGAAGDSERGGK